MGTNLSYITRSTRSGLTRRGECPDAFALKACIDSLQRQLAKVEALAAGYRAEFDRSGEIMGDLNKT